MNNLNASKMDNLEYMDNTISQDWISVDTEILSPVTKWMSLEGTKLSKTRQRQTLYTFTYMWNLKNKWTNLQNKHSHRHKEQTDGFGGGGRWGGAGNRWELLKHTNSKLKNKSVTGMKCTAWEIWSVILYYLAWQILTNVLHDRR